MDTNKMRLGLSYIFFENENIPSETKSQLINFIEKADMHQLKVLCMDGEVIGQDKLDETVRQIIDDRFDESLYEKINAAAIKGLDTAIELKFL